MAEDTDGRSKAIDMAMGQIEKQFGKGSIIKLGSRETADVNAISTGSISIDAALGVGGMPKGRVSEIFGPESSGKTTLAIHIIAEAQKAGGMAAFVDAEHALDAVYAKALGVDTDELLVSQPDSGEQALEITEVLIRSGAVDVIVIDSVAALVPRAELDGEMGDAQMGLQARLMSQAMRKLTAITSKSNTCLVFINQIREKIGVMFGNPETTTGVIRRSALISGGSRPSKTATRSWAIAPESKSSRTKSPRPSARQSSTFCMAKGSRKRAISSTSRCRPTSLKRAAHGTPTAKSVSVRAARTLAASS